MIRYLLARITMVCLLTVVLVCICSGPFRQVTAGIICYNCDLLPHQRDCDNVLECGEQEVCYGEKVIRDDGIVTFKSGCKPQQVCNAAYRGASLLFGKRNTISSCSKCCNTSYCNLETCDQHVKSVGIRCLSCQYVLKPSDCFTSVQCNENEICYTESIVHNHERRYRLGCIHNQQCESGVAVGKRDVQALDYCGQCCTGQNCNRDLCTNSTQSSSKIQHPPILPNCRDSDSRVCANSSRMLQCNQDDFKYYHCPFSCGTCTAQIGVDPCLSHLCLNGGICKNDNGRFKCECKSFFTGVHCENVAECDSNHNLKWNGSCYSIIALMKPWNEHMCDSEPWQNIRLVTINSRDEHEEITNFISRLNYSSDNIWLGPRYSTLQKHWVWSNGDRLNNHDTRWEPNSFHHSKEQYCVAMHNGKWTTSLCTQAQFYMCERPLFQTTTIEPTTSIVTRTTTNIRHIHPTKAPSHKHHVCDGLFVEGHTCYLLLRRKDIWTESMCESKGMILATITSNREHNAIVHYVRDQEKYHDVLWLGGRYYDEHNIIGWKWVEGYGKPDIVEDHVSHWKDGHNYHNYCVTLDNDKWGTEPCNNTFYHLCEKRFR